MTQFLGIDLGTTFLKGAVLHLEERRLSHIHREPFPEPVPGLPAGHFEVDPVAVLESTRKLISELLAHAPDATGVMLSSQMHGLVLVDEAGRPRSRAMTWKDQRATELQPDGRTFLDWLGHSIPDRVRAETGREFRSGVPVVTLAWLQCRGELPTGAFPVSLPDFVLSSLCGIAPFAERTHAASGGLLNLARNEWHGGLIEHLGLSALRWPRLVDTGELVGHMHIAGKRLACYAPVGDQQCALLGAGLGDGELSVNISTGSQVSVRTNTLHTGDFLVRPYPGGGWLNTVVQVPAGRSLSVLVNLLTELGEHCSDPWEYIAAETEKLTDTTLRVDLGFFGGPFGGNGAISTISEQNFTVGNLFLAAFQNMAQNFAKCAQRLAEVPWHRVVFSGGLAHSFPVLRRLTLRAVGTENHRVCPHTEDTLMGLLTLALLASGQAVSIAEATGLVQQCHAK